LTRGDREEVRMVYDWSFEDERPVGMIEEMLPE